jgi:FG-GAP-like repeat/Secretion system C-terminal sorting domain
LISVAPGYNSPAAALASDVQLFFRKPVVLAAGSPIAVRGSLSGTRTGTLTGSGTRQIRFNPNRDWLPGEEVTVVYRTMPATLDLAQPTQALAAPISYRFRGATAPAAGPLTSQVPALTTGLSARQVEAADLDGDGDTDLVLVGALAGGGGGQVVVLRHDATGFTPIATLATATVSYIALGDLNNDGAPDLLISDGEAPSSTITTFRNPGTGAFTGLGGLASQINLGPVAHGLQLADLNFDGYLDLLTVNSDGTLSRRLNDGTGQLISSAATIAIPTVQAVLPYSLRNGVFDQFVVGTDTEVRLYTNNGGTGNMTSPSSIGSAFAPVADLAAGDFNGDSLTDVLITTVDGLQVAYKTASGYQFATLLTGVACTTAKPADLDGDGDLDVLAPGALNSLYVFRNDGAGNFALDTPIALNAPNSQPSWVAVADLNGDGTLDAVTANGLSTNSATLLLNTAPNGARSAIVSTVRALAGEYDNVTVTGTGTLVLGADLTITGTLTVQNGGTLRLAGYRLQGAGAVVVQAGATVETYSPDGLQVSGALGDLQNTGGRTFSVGARYVYAGTEPQQTGPALPGTVLDLVIDNIQGVTLTNPTNITRALVLTNGDLTSNGKLTLLSSATGTAQVINTNGVVVGNATMQRYSSSALTGYRHISAPVANTTFADLATPGFVPRVNALYNTNPAAVPAASYPNIFGYDETRLTGTGATADFGRGYVSPTALTAPIVPTKGYTAYLPPTAKPDFVGTLNNGTISSGPLTRGSVAESGWQLLGNPYPSPLKWDVLAATLPAAISREVFVFRPTGGNSGTYVSRLNGVSTSDPNGVLANGWISPMQGFFVRVLANTTGFNFTNAARPTGLQTAAAYRTAEPTQVHLSLTPVNQPARADYAAVYCAQGATTALDPDFDAPKQRSVGEAPSIFTRPLGTADELSINGIAPLAASEVILPIGLVIPVAGTYTLGATTVSLPSGWRVFLDDALTGTSHELTTTPYALTLPVGEMAPGRFQLRLTLGGVLGVAPTADVLASALSLSPNPARETVQVQLAHQATENTAVTILDARGAVVRTVRSALGSTTTTVAVGDLPAGVYVVRVGARTQRLVVQ